MTLRANDFVDFRGIKGWLPARVEEISKEEVIIAFKS
jgi:hypothetical protein